MKTLFLALVFLVTFPALAANHYIRQGASGAADGSNWTDAWTSVPASLTRGDTYYVADGTYAGFTFDDAIAGTTRVTVLKATIADHGTETGWVSTYGDGVALFGKIQVNDTGYFTLDGNGVLYGIKIEYLTDDGSKLFSIGGFSDVNRDGIELRYVEIAGPQSTTPGSNYPFAFYTDCISATSRCGSDGISDFVLSHCNIHGGAQLLQMCNLTNAIIEYSKIHDCLATYSVETDIHANLAYLQDSRNLTFRYNEVYNWNQQGFYPEYTTTGDMKIYGNVFRDSSSKAIWFYETATFENVYIYNNTFSNITEYAIWINGASTIITNGAIKNNLFVSSGTVTYNTLTHDYNWYSGASDFSEANGVVGGSVNPFGNFPMISSTIAADYPRNKGETLGAEYNQDPNGNTRGADGEWDIGAYEISSAAAETPTAKTYVGKLIQY